MPDTSDQSPEARAQRLRIALDLAASGIQMKLNQLRRRHPDESDAQIQERLNKWLRNRPMDSPGRHIDPATILDP